MSFNPYSCIKGLFQYKEMILVHWSHFDFHHYYLLLVYCGFTHSTYQSSLEFAWLGLYFPEVLCLRTV